MEKRAAIEDHAVEDALLRDDAFRSLLQGLVCQEQITSTSQSRSQLYQRVVAYQHKYYMPASPLLAWSYSMPCCGYGHGRV